MQNNYKRLGDYIEEVKVKNENGIISNLQGININKFFMPSVANVVGTDLSRYKVVEENQFACNRMHVGRDYRLPIALSKKKNPFIVSPAYDVFKIAKKKELLPDYLMMWFSRKEFDRNSWFHTDTDVRGKLGWDDFMNFELPIPPIAEQQEIVNEYQVLSERIALNEQMNEKLEATAQALYKHWFVDFEFPNENGKPYKSSGGKMVYNEVLDKDIPVGWTVKEVKEYCIDMKSGGTPSRTNIDYWNSFDVPWLKTGEIKNNIILSTEEFISFEGLKSSSAKLLPINTVLMSMYGANAGEVGFLKIESSTNQACCGMVCDSMEKASFLYYHLVVNQEYNYSQAIGGAQQNLSKDYIENIKLLVSCGTDLSVFKTFIENKEINTKQTQTLKTMQALLLAKMGR